MSTASLEQAFFAADPAYDGRFVGAVLTTGIYCRPSCRARKPLPANVTYLADAAAARTAGYRPCLRCQPDDVPAGHHAPADRADSAGSSPLVDRAERQLREYLAGDRADFDLPIQVPGSPFQERISARRARRR